MNILCLFIRSLANGQLDYFQCLAIVNKAIIHILLLNIFIAIYSHTIKFTH